MRRRATVLISLAIVIVLGFYAGKTVLPGLTGQGAGAIVPDPGKSSPQGSTQGNTTPPEPGQSQTPNPSGQTSSGEQKPGGVDKDTYWIDVDVTAQTVEIMQGDEAVKTMTASTGIEGKETPLGTFEIQNRGEWFFSEKYQQGAKYWVSFKDWGIYLFHSLAMDKDQKVIPEEAEKLGKPASHGCVRLPIEDAKWIYDNIPQKTKVVIHE